MDVVARSHEVELVRADSTGEESRYVILSLANGSSLDDIIWLGTVGNVGVA